MELLTRTADLEAVEVDTDARTITARLCRWSDPRPVVDPDGHAYREQYPPGSLRLAPDVHVTDAHHGTLIGRATELRDEKAGPTIVLRVADTAAGRDALALVDADVIRSVSMEFAPDPDGAVTDGDLVTRTASTVHGVAFAFRPAHDAPILTRQQGDPMTDVMPDTPILAVDAPAPDTLELRGDLDALSARVAVLAERPDVAPVAHPAAAYPSLGHYAQARLLRTADTPELLLRALVDQITTNNPGVIPPAWLSEVMGIVNRARATINAFGVRSAGASGMDINWPYFDGDLTTLVGAQTAEKTAIVSARVDLKRGTEPLITYAGGSDVSYQLIERSDPSYLDAYMRIMAAAYAVATDNAAADAALASATGQVDQAPIGGTAEQIKAALFAASAQVETATGSPASFALASTDVFGAIGSLPGLWPVQYGTTNTAGTADAATLNVNVSGLPVYHEPNFAAGTLLVSNSMAGAWVEDGPRTVSAEDVERLGRNVAVWGMGAFAAFLPAGIVKISDVTP